jgi:hypothetical protein
MRRLTGSIAGLGVLAVLALGATPIASAKDGDVRVAGNCTKTSTSKLKLSAENGRIEVEFEVDQNRNGVRWVLGVSQNGRKVFAGTRVTKAPSGSFEARLLASNAATADRFVATAKSPSGEVCTARATFS